MKKIKYFLLMILAGILVLVAIGFFMTRGQPKVTVNYLAEYNRISKPANYDPCQNAVQLYEEAFESFVQMPKILTRMDADWLDDFNEAQQDLLQKWLTANEDCFQKFRTASQKPYYWLERRAFDNELQRVNIFEWHEFYPICQAILWNAKVNAANSKYTEAFNDILACYCAGFQQCNTSHFRIELQNSLWQQQAAVETASLILKKTQVPVSVLNSFKQELEKIFDIHECFFDLTAEKLTLYDVLQRTYVYKADGTGRLSWKHKSDFYTMCGDNTNWLVIKSCFVGPSQNEVKNEIDAYYEKVMTAFTLMPWELHQAQPDFFEKLFLDCQRGTIVLYVLGSDYRREYYNFYNTQAQLQALLTTIAAIRFHQDKGHLPNKLDELINAGYLQKLPADPYNDKPLIYKVEGENFKIYSIGNNFKDDGGKGGFLPQPLCSSNASLDLVFWPPIEPWKLRLEHLKKIQDSNQPSQKPSE